MKCFRRVKKFILPYLEETVRLVTESDLEAVIRNESNINAQLHSEKLLKAGGVFKNTFHVKKVLTIVAKLKALIVSTVRRLR